MAVSAGETTQLPCGRPLAPLVEQVADRRPPADPEHQAGCRYCQAALAELDALWSDVGELARRRIEVPPGLVAAAMRRIDRERGRSPRPPTAPHGPRPGRPKGHAVLPSARGETRIADGIVAAVAGRAALAVPGVRSAPVEVRLDGAGDGDAGRGSVALALELTVELGPPLPELVAAVRAAVVAAVEGLTGVSVIAVDVAVADLARD